ncbi:MAG: antibiotic biosynthesis monooxygenase [Halieaceae bacterium]|jgi:heme-degrading monooxygenase HmoA|nr:antibiotic biosynthesis monooxygenase [Halieaceae bacterium]
MIYFIFEIRITDPQHTAEDYAAAWVAASRLIQRAPGALGTRLHRKIGDPRTLLAIASWESKAARDAMEGTAAEEIERIIASQAPYVSIRVIGEFEAPAWEVLPLKLD